MWSDEFLRQWNQTNWTQSSTSWRASARRCIEAVVVAGLDKGKYPAEVARDIDDAYPFGIREHFPYQVWLEERNLACWILGLCDLTKANQRRYEYHMGLRPTPVSDDQLPLSGLEASWLE